MNRMPVPITADELVHRYRSGERDFRGITLTDATIEEDLPDIDLSESSLRIVFSDTRLDRAKFRNADLAFCQIDASLISADLQGAGLEWANITANLAGANLTG